MQKSQSNERCDDRTAADLERFAALIKLLPEEPLPPTFFEDVRRKLVHVKPTRTNVWWTAPMRFLYAAASVAVVLFVVTPSRERRRQPQDVSVPAAPETAPAAEHAAAPPAPVKRMSAAPVRETRTLAAPLAGNGFVLRGRTSPVRPGNVVLVYHGTVSGIASERAVAVCSPAEYAAFSREYPDVAVPDGWNVDFEHQVLVAAFLGRQPAGLRHAVDTVVFGRREVSLQVTTSGYPAARAGHGATQETPYLLIVVER